MYVVYNRNNRAKIGGKNIAVFNGFSFKINATRTSIVMPYRTTGARVNCFFVCRIWQQCLQLPKWVPFIGRDDRVMFQ